MLLKYFLRRSIVLLVLGFYFSMSQASELLDTAENLINQQKSKNVGIEYEIYETDVIIGVAGFAYQ